MKQKQDDSGYSEYAKQLIRKWYGYDIPKIFVKGGWYYAPGYSERSAWCCNLEQCDIDALWAAGRLQCYYDSPPSPDEVNERLKHPSLHPHFSIRGAMFCCVKARCEAAKQPLELKPSRKTCTSKMES